MTLPSSFTQRLFFEDTALLITAQKLAALIEEGDSDNYEYLEALGRLLAHELVGFGRGPGLEQRIAERRSRRLARAGSANLH
jgi:hypothetical protein